MKSNMKSFTSFMDCNIYGNEHVLLNFFPVRKDADSFSYLNSSSMLFIKIIDLSWLDFSYDTDCQII